MGAQCGTAMRFVHGWCGTRPHNPHRASTGAPAPAPARTRAPELPHSSAGCARGARRHRAARAHVTVPITSRHLARAHRAPDPPVRSAMHPYCTLVACACACGSPTQTRVRAHRRRDLSVLPRAAPARPQRPTGTIQHIPSEEDATHGPSKVLEPHTSDL